MGDCSGEYLCLIGENRFVELSWKPSELNWVTVLELTELQGEDMLGDD